MYVAFNLKAESSRLSSPTCLSSGKGLLGYAPAWRRHGKKTSKLGAEVDNHTGWSYFKQCHFNRAGGMIQELRALVARTQPMIKIENGDKICISCC